MARLMADFNDGAVNPYVAATDNTMGSNVATPKSSSDRNVDRAIAPTPDATTAGDVGFPGRGRAGYQTPAATSNTPDATALGNTGFPGRGRAGYQTPAATSKQFTGSSTPQTKSGFLNLSDSGPYYADTTANIGPNAPRVNFTPPDYAPGKDPLFNAAKELTGVAPAERVIGDVAGKHPESTPQFLMDLASIPPVGGKIVKGLGAGVKLAAKGAEALAEGTRAAPVVKAVTGAPAAAKAATKAAASSVKGAVSSASQSIADLGSAPAKAAKVAAMSPKEIAAENYRNEWKAQKARNIAAAKAKNPQFKNWTSTSNESESTISPHVQRAMAEDAERASTKTTDKGTGGGSASSKVIIPGPKTPSGGGSAPSLSVTSMPSSYMSPKNTGAPSSLSYSQQFSPAAVLDRAVERTETARSFNPLGPDTAEFTPPTKLPTIDFSDIKTPVKDTSPAKTESSGFIGTSLEPKTSAGSLAPDASPSPSKVSASLYTPGISGAPAKSQPTPSTTAAPSFSPSEKAATFTPTTVSTPTAAPASKAATTPATPTTSSSKQFSTITSTTDRNVDRGTPALAPTKPVDLTQIIPTTTSSSSQNFSNTDIGELSKAKLPKLGTMPSSTTSTSVSNTTPPDTASPETQPSTQLQTQAGPQPEVSAPAPITTAVSTAEDTSSKAQIPLPTPTGGGPWHPSSLV